MRQGLISWLISWAWKWQGGIGSGGMGRGLEPEDFFADEPVVQNRHILLSHVRSLHNNAVLRAGLILSRHSLHNSLRIRARHVRVLNLNLTTNKLCRWVLTMVCLGAQHP